MGNLFLHISEISAIEEEAIFYHRGVAFRLVYPFVKVI